MNDPRPEAELDLLRAAATAASQRAASAQDALDAALAAHRGELDQRAQMSARAAAVHQEEASRLSQQLEQARLPVAAATAQVDAADVRAARAEDANRKLAQHDADTDASLGRLQVDVAKANGVI